MFIIVPCAIYVHLFKIVRIHSHWVEAMESREHTAWEPNPITALRSEWEWTLSLSVQQSQPSVARPLDLTSVCTNPYSFIPCTLCCFKFYVHLMVGNQYTSVQQLDSDQLQQIMQVVQQQQQRMKKGSEPTQTVIYNPSSQTRIVYRYISHIHSQNKE